MVYGKQNIKKLETFVKPILSTSEKHFELVILHAGMSSGYCHMTNCILN